MRKKNKRNHEFHQKIKARTLSTNSFRFPGLDSPLINFSKGGFSFAFSTQFYFKEQSFEGG
jgi:hypothetical protein